MSPVNSSPVLVVDLEATCWEDRYTSFGVSKCKQYEDH
jgi:inhibitor of KinA sporulation pathway (predicted exonuclease)